jgi:hypothetical protein
MRLKDLVKGHVSPFVRAACAPHRTRQASPGATWTTSESGVRPQHDPSRTEPASGIAALRRKPAAPRAGPPGPTRAVRQTRSTRKDDRDPKPAYVKSYENLAFTRDDDGVLVLRFHTNSGSVMFTGRTHKELPASAQEPRSG